MGERWDDGIEDIQASYKRLNKSQMNELRKQIAVMLEEIGPVRTTAELITAAMEVAMTISIMTKEKLASEAYKSTIEGIVELLNRPLPASVITEVNDLQKDIHRNLGG